MAREQVTWLLTGSVFGLVGLVNGITGLADLTRFGVKHQTVWTMEDAKKQGAMINVSE